jgi:hypothetical protein
MTGGSVELVIDGSKGPPILAVTSNDLDEGEERHDSDIGWITRTAVAMIAMRK